jgi:hypothetical protein
MRVPILDMHESVIDNFRARDADGEIVKDAMLDAVASAMAEARTAAERIAALSEAVGTDRTITLQAGALKLRQAALKSSEKVAGKLDQARAKVTAEIERMARDTAKPPDPATPLAMQLEAEMRTRLAAMKEDERRRVIGVGFNKRDALLMASVLRHPALIGMTASEFDVCRERYRWSEHPVEADRIERLTKGVAALDNCGKSFIGMIETATKSPAAVKAAQAVETVQKLEAAE